MDNFDLKKYLVENKVTRNSRMMNEDKTSDYVSFAMQHIGDESTPVTLTHGFNRYDEKKYKTTLGKALSFIEKNADASAIENGDVMVDGGQGEVRITIGDQEFDIVKDKTLNEAEATSVDKVLDNPKVKKAGEELAKNPAKLKKALDQAKAAGVDIEALKQAAKAVQAGKPVDNIVRDEVEDLKAEKAKEDKAMEEASGAVTGAATGGVAGAFLTTMLAAATIGAAPVFLPALAIGTLISALAGAGIGKYADKMGW